MGLFYWFWDDILGLKIILPVFTMLGINAAALPMFVIVLIKLILTLVLLYLIQLVLRKAVKVLRGWRIAQRWIGRCGGRARATKRGGRQRVPADAHGRAGYRLDYRAVEEGEELRAHGGNLLTMNRHKEAAKWFRKAGDRKRCAMEIAKTGNTLKAAKMLMKEGDYGNAANFFAEKGKFVEAAKA